MIRLASFLGCSNLGTWLVALGDLGLFLQQRSQGGNTILINHGRIEFLQNQSRGSTFVLVGGERHQYEFDYGLYGGGGGGGGGGSLKGQPLFSKYGVSPEGKGKRESGDLSQQFVSQWNVIR